MDGKQMSPLVLLLTVYLRPVQLNTTSDKMMSSSFSWQNPFLDALMLAGAAKSIILTQNCASRRG
jgi:hypothetical protein